MQTHTDTDKARFKAIAKAKRKALLQKRVVSQKPGESKKAFRLRHGLELIQFQIPTIRKAARAIGYNYTGAGIDLNELESRTIRQLAYYFGKNPLHKAISDKRYMYNLAKSFATKIATKLPTGRGSMPIDALNSYFEINADNEKSNWQTEYYENMQRVENVVVGKSDFQIAYAPWVSEKGRTPIAISSNRVSNIVKSYIGIPGRVDYSLTQLAKLANVPQWDLQLIEYAYSYTYLSKDTHNPIINWTKRIKCNDHIKGMCYESEACTNKSRLAFIDNLPSYYKNKPIDTLRYQLRRVAQNALQYRNDDRVYGEYQYHNWNEPARYNDIRPFEQPVVIAISQYDGDSLRRQFAKAAIEFNTFNPHYEIPFEANVQCPLHYHHENGNECSPNSNCEWRITIREARNMRMANYEKRSV